MKEIDLSVFSQAVVRLVMSDCFEVAKKHAGYIIAPCGHFFLTIWQACVSKCRPVENLCSILCESKWKRKVYK